MYRQQRSDKIDVRTCNCCNRTFDTKNKYSNHFLRAGNTCVRLKHFENLNKMKRIFEDDEEPMDNEYKSLKKHWMETLKDQWDDSSDKKAYLFENILTHRQVSSKKLFFDRLGDELNKEIG